MKLLRSQQFCNISGPLEGRATPPSPWWPGGHHHGGKSPGHRRQRSSDLHPPQADLEDIPGLADISGLLPRHNQRRVRHHHCSRPTYLYPPLLHSRHTVLSCHLQSSTHAQYCHLSLCLRPSQYLSEHKRSEKSLRMLYFDLYLHHAPSHVYGQHLLWRQCLHISKYGNLLSICKKLVKILLYLCLKLFARCIIILIHLQKFCSECRGRSHEFYYNLEDFYEDFSDGKALALGILSLPLLHPFWLAILLCVCSNFVIVPICYGRIYRCD